MYLNFYTIIGASIIVIIYVVWIFFRTTSTAKSKKELLDIELDDEEILQELPKLIEKEEIFYQLNTHAIKLNLYPKSYFGNNNIEKIYQKIVIDNYWLDEPFHTEFSNLLQFIGSNNLWIKDPKSREIIINIRDNNDKLNKQISMNVLSLSEVLYSVIEEVYLDFKYKKPFNKYEIQNSILSASIYVLSEAGEIGFICKSLGIIYTDKESLRYDLVDQVYENLSVNEKAIITKNDFLNSIFITKIYNEVILNSHKYPYTFSINEPKAPAIKQLSYTSKKKLISICEM